MLGPVARDETYFVVITKLFLQMKECVEIISAVSLCTSNDVIFRLDNEDRKVLKTTKAAGEDVTDTVTEGLDESE